MTAAAHPRLSLAMIVANDPEGVERTLASVHDVVDDIVICDTGDRDSSRALAQQFRGRVIQQPWCDSFSVARNECLRHVLGDWVLWLDAGETLTDTDKQGLRDHVQRTAAGTTAYMMIVKRPPAPGTIAGEQIARLRLVPVRPGIWYRGRVREAMVESLRAAGMTIEGLPFRIERGESEHAEEVKERRARRNIELADLEMRDGGAKPRLLNCLGEAFQTVGQFEEARSFYQQAVSQSPRGSADLLEACYGLLTVEEAAPQGEDRKFELALKALEYFPLDMQLLCAMGGYLQAGGQWDLALRSYETAYRFGQIQPEVWHMEHVHAIAAECYALCLQLRQRGEEAGRVIEEAARAHPEAPRLRRQLIDVYVKQGRSDEAQQLAVSLHSAPPTLAAASVSLNP